MAAVAVGAKLVERHITMDKTWKGNDHAASLDMSELAELIKQIRIVETALGTPLKEMRASEIACHNKVYQNLVSFTTLV